MNREPVCLVCLVYLVRLVESAQTLNRNHEADQID